MPLALPIGDMARSFYLRVEPGQKFLLEGKLDGELCVVYKREHKQIQYAEGGSFIAEVAFYYRWNGPYPTEKDYEIVCDCSSVGEVRDWMRATPDHVLEEVDEAAIYSEDDWEGEIASIEAASDAEHDEQPTERELQARTRAERAAARASMEVSD